MNDKVIHSFNSHSISQEKIIVISFIAMIFSVFVLKLLKTIINFTPQLKMMIKEIKKEDDLYEKVKIL